MRLHVCMQYTFMCMNVRVASQASQMLTEKEHKEKSEEVRTRTDSHLLRDLNQQCLSTRRRRSSGGASRASPTRRSRRRPTPTALTRCPHRFPAGKPVNSGVSLSCARCRGPIGLPLGAHTAVAACDVYWLDSDLGRMESVAIGSTASASSAESAEAEPPAAAASDAHSHSAHASLSGLAAKWGQGTTEFAEMMRLASKDWRMLILFKIFSFVPLVRWDGWMGYCSCSLLALLRWSRCSAQSVHRTDRARAVRSRSPALGCAARNSTECERSSDC